MRSRYQPGLALAAGVLIAALLALVLIDGGGPGGPSPAPAPGEGLSLPLLPGGGADAAVAQYGFRHRGGRALLLGPPRRP